MHRPRIGEKVRFGPFGHSGVVVAIRGDYAVVDYYGWEQEVWIPALNHSWRRAPALERSRKPTGAHRDRRTERI